MSVEIFKIDTLKIKLVLDDLKMRDVSGNLTSNLPGNNIEFKPSMIDTELGKEIYFTKD